MRNGDERRLVPERKEETPVDDADKLITPHRHGVNPVFARYAVHNVPELQPTAQRRQHDFLGLEVLPIASIKLLDYRVDVVDVKGGWNRQLECVRLADEGG